MAQLIPKSSLLIWQRPEWPYFTWDSSALLDSLVQLRHQQGRLLALPLAPAGPFTDIEQDIISHPEMEMTKERLCGWQASLFPNGFSGVYRITVGDFRNNDFTLNLKYTPPFAKKLDTEIEKFLTWWNDSPVGLDGIIRAGIAYFWLMTIQPFEDGNARVAKNIVSLALAQDEKQGLRPYDIERIFVDRQQEIEGLILACQDLNGDITLWLNWLFARLIESIEIALKEKTHLSAELLFLKRIEHLKLNSRQKKIISFLFSKEGYLKPITNRQCVELCKSSRESLKRDLSELVHLNLLKRGNSLGRSIDYVIVN